MRTWSTPEVVKLTGVTARTLRHYDAIGLLAPASHDHGGLRRYGQAELLRLQQILLLRRLGLGLGTIGGVVDGDLTAVAALKRHAEEIGEEQRRLDRLADTVAATIRQLEGGQEMAPETWFEGLDAATEADYRTEARRRWGQAVVERAWTVLQDMSPEERRAIPAEFNDINDRLAALRKGGKAPGDAVVQEVVAEHYRLIARHWDSEPGAEAYRGLGALYTEDPRFRDTYEQVAEVSRHLCARRWTPMRRRISEAARVACR